MKYFAIFYFLLKSVAGISQENEQKKQLKALMGKTDAGTYTMNYFTDAAKYAYTKVNQDDKWDTKYQQAIKEANTNAERFNADFQKIIQDNKRKADNERMIVKTAEFIGRVAVSPVESLPIWGPIQKEINNQIFQKMDQELTDNYRRKLYYSLDKIRQQNQERYGAIISSGNFDEVRQALQEANFFANSAYDELDPEYKEIVEKSQEKFLRQAVQETLHRTIQEIGNQQFEIEKVNSNIAKLSKFTYEYAAKSNEKFRQLAVAQQQLNDRLNGFQEQYGRDKKALDFMQEFMYSKMNTKERIAALKAGMLSNLSEEERAKRVAQLSILQKKEEVVTAAKEFLNSASLSIEVLRNLGLGDNPLVADIAQAVNIGQTAINAFEQFSSGNYLQFAVTVTGFFKKGGSDAAAERHKQIMQALKIINIKLDRIESKIDNLLKGQEEILKLQGETLDVLLQLSKTIDVQHAAVMNSLNNIENAVYENRQLILQQWEASCQSCLDILDRLKLDIDQGLLPKDSIVKNEWVDIKSSALPNCETYLDRFVFSFSDGTVNPVFKLVTHIANINQNNFRTLDTVNRLSFFLLGRNSPIGKLKTKSNFMTSLFFPSINVGELQSRIEADTLILASDLYPTSPILYSTILEPQVVERHGFVVRNISFLKDLTDIDKNLITLEQFTSENPPRHRTTRRELTNAIKLTNVAIAQQAILAGDILLPIITDISDKVLSSKQDSAYFQTAKHLLALNSILGNNFSKYYVSNFIRKNKISAMQYGFAYNSRDSLNMAKLIHSPFTITYLISTDPRFQVNLVNDGWYMLVNNVPYALPEPSELNSAPISQTEHLMKLVAGRDYLLRKYLSDQLIQDPNLKESTNYLIMKN